jgi:hypothetical protein
MKVTPVQLLILVVALIALSILIQNRREKLCQIGSLNNTIPIRHSKIQPCDTSLGQAPFGNPRTWIREANPVLTGMYK